jgi:hypothetical protein
MKSLGRYGRRREDNIKTCHKELVWEDTDWIHVPQERAMWRGGGGPCEHGNEP